MITEKSATAQESNKHSFIVDPRATKIDIKREFQIIYGLKVAKVNIVAIKPKTKWGHKKSVVQKRNQAKKAIITLAPNQKLDLKKDIKSTKK
ncbi:MAG: 50S ribosomal protein L23 [Patescibacteria group bacterium]|nr:50S ribosomal protein L23 [Patescibacteria group bacterium]